MILDRAALIRRVSAAAGAAVGGGGLSARALAREGERGTIGLPSHPRWKFVFVSQLTTSPLFVPLQYGIQDACSLVGCTYLWTGSPSADTGEVVGAVRSAVKGKADGIALPLVDWEALRGPVAAAEAAGIPVIAYHVDARGADSPPPFVGQDAGAAGVATGQRIASLVPSGAVALLVSERGQLPVERRLQGALARLRKAAPAVRPRVVATTLDPYEANARIDHYVGSNKQLRGLFALELAASEGVNLAVVNHKLRAKGVKAGSYGVLPATLKLIEQGDLAFTVDEQPYLQGFVPTLQLFLTRISGGLLAPSDTDLQAIFVTRRNLKPYVAKTRYEGSSSKQRYPIQ